MVCTRSKEPYGLFLLSVPATMTLAYNIEMVSLPHPRGAATMQTLHQVYSSTPLNHSTRCCYASHSAEVCPRLQRSTLCFCFSKTLLSIYQPCKMCGTSSTPCPLINQLPKTSALYTLSVSYAVGRPAAERNKRFLYA